MREIKFRAIMSGTNNWIIGYPREVYENGIDSIENNNGCEYIRTDTLGQFTGLRDKNWTDIYEGDIVRILYTDWSSKLESDRRTLQQYLIDIATIGVIEFNKDRFCVKTKSKKYSDFNYNSILPGEHGYIEIIGNIYENPELLK